ncbi:MAG: M20/M25/M40 family metallo-hydrolase [Gammaproteobacteria bacterium]|nr:M20/M25/M40 family metallo-hydrolase [Gammaproteobacteria bacterium]
MHVNKLLLILIFLSLPLAACAPDTSSHSDVVTQAPERPVFELTTDEAYDLGTIGAYPDDHAEIYDYIDANIDAHLRALQRWLRQPSISAQNVGIEQMAEMLRGDLENLGFQEAKLVPTDGHPGVWAYYDAGNEKTLVVYLMYDVQPVDPEDWQSPPFAANLVDHDLGKVLMARGATNQKGPQRAFLNALESIIAVDGSLPVNVMIAAEGEEELGSPHYHQIVDRYFDRLKTADAALFPFNSQRPDGNISVILGVKGILYVEMTATGGSWGGPADAEIHGSYKAIVDSPVWRLIKALSSLTSPDGNTILVSGYYDGIVPPTAEESLLINAAIEQRDDVQLQELLGVSRWIDGKTGNDAAIELLYQPTLNIDGIWSGYTGEGVKTILPHTASAKVDSRLPPGLDPDEALAKIRHHLDSNGFDDISIEKLSAYPASQTSIETPEVRAALGVFKKYASGVAVQPRIAGSAPFYQFTDRLGLPLIPAGMGFGTGAHAPNEIMLIEPGDGVPVAGLAEIEKAYVDFIYALAD